MPLVCLVRGAPMQCAHGWVAQRRVPTRRLPQLLELQLVREARRKTPPTPRRSDEVGDVPGPYRLRLVAGVEHGGSVSCRQIRGSHAVLAEVQPHRHFLAQERSDESDGSSAERGLRWRRCTALPHKCRRQLRTGPTGLFHRNPY